MNQKKNKERKKTKQFEDFIEYLGKLEAVEFFGICKLLGIPCTKTQDNTEEPQIELFEFEILLERVMDKFLGLNSRQRKEVLNLLKDLVLYKKEGD